MSWDNQGWAWYGIREAKEIFHARVVHQRAQFQQGFASAQRVVITMGEPTGEGAAGTIYANVPILIVATNTNQARQTFCGVYTLRRTNAPPFDQLGWSISRASIKATANVQPGSAQAHHLVSGGC